MYKIFVVICISFLLVTGINAKKRTPEQALTLLKSKVQTDRYYQRWLSKECLSFDVERVEPFYIDVAMREKTPCSHTKDVKTMPIINRFRVSRIEDEILCFYFLDGSYVDYAQCQEN